MIIEKTAKLEELASVAEFFSGDRAYLYGDLWAGKTALVRAVAKAWGIAEDVKSPTYVYYRKYAGDFYHFDLYRIEDYDTFVNIGGEEILDDSRNTAFIEWPDVISDRYPPTITVRIEKTEDPNLRTFRIERHSMP